MGEIMVPAARLPRWLENFAGSHGNFTLTTSEGALRGDALDGSWFRARLPFDRGYAGPPDLDGFLSGVLPPDAWGVLLVRKGGFAVARLHGARMLESKVGRRHVQGRTKAGGQSQQRFARRRDNQARQAYEAAAEHAVRILGAATGQRRLTALVTGGDHSGVEAVLADPRLCGHPVVGPWLAVPDPRRGVLETSVADACSVTMSVTNT
ncbi:MAG: acVLRF1 family peptidyl-tRNA hydrolase [Marmoricola sp.]